MDEKIEIKHGVEPTMTVGQEEVVFTMGDGGEHKIVLKDILESGAAGAALAYAQLILLQALIHQQKELAGAMNALANVLRELVGQPPQQTSAVDMPRVAQDAATAIVGALKSAGVPLPSIPGAKDGNRT
jgi:hypothetical protein